MATNTGILRGPKKNMASLELEHSLVDFVSKLDTTIAEAKDVNTVISALSCMASLLLPNHKHLLLLSSTFITGDIENHLSGDLEQLASVCKQRAQNAFQGQDPLTSIAVIFYRGLPFLSLVKILINRVSTDWLICFPASVQSFLFDDFFTCAPPSEVLAALAPMLTPGYYVVEEGQVIGMDLVCEVVQRLLVLCLIEKQGLKKIALDYGVGRAEQNETAAMSHEWTMLKNQDILSIAQFVASIPDKARLRTSSSSQYFLFYQSATSQLLDAAEAHWMSQIRNRELEEVGMVNGTFLFIGEVFAKFCRRGLADVVVSEMLPPVLQHVKSVTSIGILSGEKLSDNQFDFKGRLLDTFWPHIVACMKDPHALERWSESLLLEMAAKSLEDWDAYCILCTLFASLLNSGHTTTRLLFTEKFLLWKVFPVCCLRWILHFAVLCCPPSKKVSSSISWIQEKGLQKDVLKHLVEVWAEAAFMQSAPIQQQAYLTAAVGISLNAVSKDELESSSDLLRLLLQGISRRLESPLPLVRQMAKRVALAFSLVINPAKPLLLDEDDHLESLSNWEELDLDGWNKMRNKNNFGDSSVHRGNSEISLKLEAKDRFQPSEKIDDDQSQITCQTQGVRKKKGEKERQVHGSYDPDEVIDLGTYVPTTYSDEEPDDTESDTSLLPYDMSDDESDLDRGKVCMQLAECAANLRKVEDSEKVERTLYILENLVRATPDELENVAKDLAYALIHLRCSTVVVEEQEESAEDKRHNTLVALLACAPNTAVQVLTQELYSPHLDVGQRLLIIEVMSDAARELSSGKDKLIAQPNAHLISELPTAKWYGPGRSLELLGSTPWKEVYNPDEMLGWAYRYERKLPLKPGQRIVGKSRRWGQKSMELRKQRMDMKGLGSHSRSNKFIAFAAAFMLPVMREYDKKSHGVDLLGRDFIVLGRLLCMLGVCMECIAYQPDVPMLAAALLDMITSRKIANHSEAYVRRSALYAASRVIVALHPSYVAQMLSGGDYEIAHHLEWIRNWSMNIAENDPDTDCAMMATACLQLHSELALQALRSIESSSQRADSAGIITFDIPKDHVFIP